MREELLNCQLQSWLVVFPFRRKSTGAGGGGGGGGGGGQGPCARGTSP